MKYVLFSSIVFLNFLQPFILEAVQSKSLTCSSVLGLCTCVDMVNLADIVNCFSCLLL